jgi:signal transduction histidine kinase/ABC-type amino acid transport substrate-binding protein
MNGQSFRPRNVVDALGVQAACVVIVLFQVVASAMAAEAPIIRGGSEPNFRPYAFIDKDHQAQGFGPDLLRAIAETMGLRLQITTGSWDQVWNDLVAGDLDVLPVVARTPSREPLVDFSLPHTETFDAFFVREGWPLIPNLAAAAGKEIVVVRSDAAHHELVERGFPGKIIPVDSLVEGLRLIRAGQHDALLCSKVVGELEREQARITGVRSGPLIPEYRRTFSFAVRKGDTDLLEKLNQGLRIIKTDGTYTQLYRKWLGADPLPPPQWLNLFWQAIGVLGVVVLIAITWVVGRKALQYDKDLTAATPSVRMRAAFWRYALAVVAVVVGFTARDGLEELVGPGLPRYITFFPAVIVVALLGGIGPGLLATGLAAIAAMIWTLAPLEEWGIASPVDRLGLALFCCLGFFMTAVAELYRRDRAKAALYEREAQLARSQRTFAQLIERAPFGFYVVDSKLRIVHMNISSQEAAFRNVRPVIGCDVGEALRTLWPESLAAEITGRFRHTLETGESYFSPRFTNQRHDLGTVESYEWELHRITLPDGQNGVICYYYDSTKLRQAEEALERQTQQLQELAQTLEQRVEERALQLRALVQELAQTEHRERARLAQVLHDGLQQFLVAARMHAELLVKATTEKQRRDCGRHLEELLGEALAISRTLSMELNPPALEEEGLGAALQWLARWMADKHHFHVDLTLATNSEPGSVTKRLVLFQCVRELLLNAIKHSGTQEAKVTLWRDPSGDLCAEVTDSGRGFDPERLASDHGVGFGLASLRQRVSLLGGTLQIKSKPGKGTRVWLKLPAVAKHKLPEQTRLT